MANSNFIEFKKEIQQVKGKDLWLHVLVRDIGSEREGLPNYISFNRNKVAIEFQ